MEQAIRTIDHEEIQEWAESRGGSPAVVEGTHDEFGTGILRVDFGERDEELEQITWQEFFRIFDNNDLAFIYQDATEDGAESYFCKFVARSEENDLGDYVEDVDIDAGNDVSDAF
jgi:hypothetical protein